MIGLKFEIFCDSSKLLKMEIELNFINKEIKELEKLFDENLKEETKNDPKMKEENLLKYRISYLESLYEKALEKYHNNPDLIQSYNYNLFLKRFSTKPKTLLLYSDNNNIFLKYQFFGSHPGIFNDKITQKYIISNPTNKGLTFILKIDYKNIKFQLSENSQGKITFQNIPIF